MQRRDERFRIGRERLGPEIVMIQGLRSGDTFPGITSQQPAQEIEGIRAETGAIMSKDGSSRLIYKPLEVHVDFSAICSETLHALTSREVVKVGP